MAAADLRAVLAVLVVVAVGMFGEVGWPLVYLGASLLIAVVGVGAVVDHRFKPRLGEMLWWGMIGWGVAAALLVSGGALASKMTLASWAGVWVIWAAVANAGSRGRRMVLLLLFSCAAVLGASVMAGTCGAPKLITNLNILVAMIVPVVPLSADLFRKWTRGRWAPLLLLIPVVLTGSRAGVLAALVIVIVLWPAGRSRHWGMALGGAGALTAIAWRLINRPESLAWHRWKIWGAIVESIGDRPLWGIGASSMAQAMGPYRLEHAGEVGRWGHIIGGGESMPLGLAVRIGLPALILGTVVLLLWFFKSRRPGPATAGALGAVVSMGLFHDFWSEPAVLACWAAVFGLCTIRCRTDSDNQEYCSGYARWSKAVAVGGLAAWALVQPAWAQWLWWHQGPSTEGVVTAVRAEPWFPEPMRWRIENLLAESEWTWAQAGEALDWSGRQVAVQRGSAAAWGLHGRIHARIVDEFGAWPPTVEKARTAFVRASALEPRLPWHPYSQALMERGLGNVGGARRIARAAVDLEPFFVRGWLLLARLELDGGDFEAARRAFDRGLIARDQGRQRTWTAYQHDLLRCPEWQVKALEEVLR